MDRRHHRGLLGILPLLLLALGLAFLIGSQVPTADGLDCPVCFHLEADTDTTCPAMPCNNKEDMIVAGKKDFNNRMRRLMKYNSPDTPEKVIDEVINSTSMTIFFGMNIDALADKPLPGELSPPKFMCARTKFRTRSSTETASDPEKEQLTGFLFGNMTIPHYTSSECLFATKAFYPRATPYTEKDLLEIVAAVRPPGEASAGTSDNEKQDLLNKVEVTIMVCDETVGMGPDCGSGAGSGVAGSPETSSGAPAAINHLILLTGLGLLTGAEAWSRHLV